jgi:hypothetical protein
MISPDDGKCFFFQDHASEMVCVEGDKTESADPMHQPS